jgi:hypothetical protein
MSSIPAVECGFELRTIRHDQPVAGRVSHSAPALLHHLLNLAVTQEIGDIPVHTAQNNVLLKMGPFEAPYALASSRPPRSQRQIIAERAHGQKFATEPIS